MDKIYILKRNRILQGPYTIAKLEERTIKSTDMVWFEGLKDWTAAGNIAELRSAIFDEPSVESNFRKGLKAKIANLFSSRK